MSIADYANKIPKQPIALIIGISGGIDSAVTSTLCAKTKLKTIVVSMPIKQNSKQHKLSLQHVNFLKTKFDNVIGYVINLDSTFSTFQETMKNFIQ